MTDCREMPLTQGKVAIVDAADFDYLNQWKWHADPAMGGKWRAARTERMPNGKRRKVYMHKALLLVDPGVDVDHRDGDGLNNRRSNLRAATRQQNAFNSGRQHDNTSGHVGVSWHRLNNGWQAYIYVNRKRIHLGHFKNKADAVRAREEAARRIHGEFYRSATGGVD